MPQIQFAAVNRHASLGLIIALWHELTTEWHPEEAEPLRTAMPRRAVIQALAVYLNSAAWPDNTRRQAERACGFETILRLTSGQLDTMHGTDEFFKRADNGRWFRPVDIKSRYDNRQIRAVELTPEALLAWSDIAKPEQDRILGEARRLLESDIESQGIVVQLLPYQGATGVQAAPAPVTRTAPAVPMPTNAGRDDYLKVLVAQIHEQPFQPVYRKRAFGAPVIGWDARLSAYFWPAPGQGYRETSSGMSEIAGTSRRLAEALTAHGAWSEPEQRQAVALAQAIFAWGGVPQDPDTVTAQSVQRVFQAALDNDHAADAHMNSGWTKVAAFATGHLEAIAPAGPQAIWDSRVATAITDRLDKLLPEADMPATLFPGVGTVPGRGGTRPRLMSRRWPSGYRSWPGQVAGGRVVREMRDILNSGDYPRMPLSDGTIGAWTTRGVEMVLFMDGY